MEVMFYIIAGKFNPSNDDFPVKTLITKDKHVYPSKPTYNHPYVSADGDVVLHGELNMNIQIKGIKSDNLMAKIEQVVAAAIEHSANEECNVEYEVIF